VRQGQQNRRGRGRNNNNNRKGGHHNPLSRSFESNGPDVKIRGTPAHIAEKYISLARDAQSTGDPVLAENYLQHAEHYSRIIMAYREQFNQSGDAANGANPRNRGLGEGGEGFDDFGDDPDAVGGEDGYVPMGAGPQPQMRQQGGEHGRPERQEQRQDHRAESRQDHQRQDHQRQDRSERQDHHRPERPFRRDQRPRFADRGERQGFGERELREQREPREPREPRGEARPEMQDRAPDAEAEPRRRDRFQQVHEQPEFLRRPVRRARSSENGESSKTEPSGE
jgi:hypothetical protein